MPPFGSARVFFNGVGGVELRTSPISGHAPPAFANVVIISLSAIVIIYCAPMAQPFRIDVSISVIRGAQRALGGSA